MFNFAKLLLRVFAQVHYSSTFCLVPFRWTVAQRIDPEAPHHRLRPVSTAREETHKVVHHRRSRTEKHHSNHGLSRQGGQRVAVFARSEWALLNVWLQAYRGESRLCRVRRRRRLLNCDMCVERLDMTKTADNIVKIRLNDALYVS